MQILGTTLAHATLSFVHPGYISAYPRVLGDYALPSGAPQIALDVGSALHLKAGAAALPPDPGPVQVMLGSISSTWTVAIAATGALFAGLVVLSLWRRGSDWARPMGVTLFGGLLLLTSWWVDGGERLAEARRRRVSRRPPPVAYAHPQQATQVILYGLIADALVNYAGRAHSLTYVHSEIAFPTARPTPGMRQARRYYLYDGWRRRFRFRRTGQTYTVTSAGADGRFGTRDDLVCNVTRANNGDWDSTRVAFFVHKSAAGAYHVFFHRFPGRNFKFHGRGRARRLTRSRVFDVLDARKVDRWGAARHGVPILGSYDRLARGKRTAPLALFVYRPPR